MLLCFALAGTMGGKIGMNVRTTGATKKKKKTQLVVDMDRSDPEQLDRQ